MAMPDSNIMESILYQLHYDGILLSFLKVGLQFNPHVNVGYVSYSDLLIFLSQSTSGSYLEIYADVSCFTCTLIIIKVIF